MPGTTFKKRHYSIGNGRLARLFRDQSGSPALDFIIVFPVLIMFMAVVIDLSWAIFASHNLNKLVRDGARYAIVHGSSSGSIADEIIIQDYIRGRAVGMVAANIVVTVTFNPNNAPGSSVTVHGDYAHELLFNFWPVGPINLIGESKLTIFQ